MSSEITCEPCQIDNLLLPASKWCIQCEESLCLECENSHRKNKASRQHALVGIMSKDKFTKVVVQNCKRHDAEQSLDHFCIDHDELCCRKCLTEDHRTCSKVVPLDVAANNVKSSAMLAHVLEQADLVKNQLKDTLIEITDGHANLQKQEQQLIDEVATYKRHIIDWLDESETFLKTEIHKIYDKRKDEIANMQQLLVEKEENMKSHFCVLNISLESDVNEHTFLLAQQFKSLIDECVKVMENKASVTNGENVRFISSENIDCSENALGKIEVTPEDITNSQICLQGLAAQSCTDMSVTNLNVNSNITEIVFKSELKLASSTQAQIRGIAVTVDGNVLVCDHSNNEVQKYLPNGIYVDSCDVKRQPWNIAILDDCSKAVVTLTGNLTLASMITISGHLRIIDIQNMVSIKEIRLGYVPLAVVSFKNEILVGTWNKIEILNQEGVLDRNLGLQWNKCAVTYLHSVSDDVIYYSASELYKTCKDGSDITRIEVISGRPRGICSDNRGFIYTATAEGKLYRLYPDGRLCDTLLNGTECYGRLWAIAFNPDFTQLYVSTRNGKSLSVFEFKY